MPCYELRFMNADGSPTLINKVTCVDAAEAKKISDATKIPYARYEIWLDSDKVGEGDYMATEPGGPDTTPDAERATSEEQEKLDKTVLQLD